MSRSEVSVLPSRSSGSGTTTAGAGFSFREARNPLRKPVTLRIVISSGSGRRR